MDDIMGKIQEVLSDEESMSQIKQLANMLGMDSNDSHKQTPPPENQDNNNSQGSQPSQSTNNNSQPDFDIAKIMMLKDVMQKANKNDPDVNFLLALRPLLKPESQDKVDKMIKIFKLMAIWPVLKDSGVLGGDLFGLL